MRFKLGLILINLLFFSKAVGSVIPTPRHVEQGELLPWSIAHTSFALEFSPLLTKYPIPSKGKKLLEKLPLNWEGIKPDVTIKVILKGQSRTLDQNILFGIPDSLGSKKEAYYLRIQKGEVLIYGFDHAGILYGVQTLSQLIRQWIVSEKIYQQVILDYPVFSFRGIMDDISRGPLSNMTFLKKQIERFSELKINVFSFYIEHVLKTKTHYLYSPEDGITLNEINELTNYADSFNIKLMGSFQSIGHYKNILSHPEYSHLGVSERMLYPGSKESIQFLQEIYTELIPVFNHPIFHINGDETYDLGRGPELSDLANKIGEGKIYFDHINPLLQNVRRLGKTPAMWGDMLLKYPEIIPLLPEGTVVFTWDYENREDFQPFIAPFQKNKIPFIVTPGIVNSYRLWPDYIQTEKNIVNFIREGWESGAAGVLTAVWDDGGRHFFSVDWYGVALASEYAWHPSPDSRRNFAELYGNIFYQDLSNSWTEFLKSLSKIQHFPSLQNLDNSLLDMTHDLDWKMPVTLDTLGYSDILDWSSVILESLNKVQQNNKEGQQDIQAWIFKIKELAGVIQSNVLLLEWSNLHLRKPADFLAENKETLEEKSLAQLRFWSAMADEFEKLWFYENREYWFKEASAVYEHRIQLWRKLLEMNSGNASEQTIQFRPGNSTYFTYWLGAGPFKVKTKEGIHTDFFAGEGGELLQKPAAVDYYPLHDEMKSWKKVISNYSDRVDLELDFPGISDCVIYLQCQLYAEEPITTVYELHFNGDHRLIVNGQLAYHSDGGLVKDGEITLKKGRNDLLLKLHITSKTDYNFSFFLPGKHLERNKYRYYLSEIP